MLFLPQTEKRAVRINFRCFDWYSDHACQKQRKRLIFWALGFPSLFPRKPCPSGGARCSTNEGDEKKHLQLSAGRVKTWCSSRRLNQRPFKLKDVFVRKTKCQNEGKMTCLPYNKRFPTLFIVESPQLTWKETNRPFNVEQAVWTLFSTKHLKWKQENRLFDKSFFQIAVKNPQKRVQGSHEDCTWIRNFSKLFFFWRKAPTLCDKNNKGTILWAFPEWILPHILE